MQPKVLIVGKDALLLESRRMLIAHAGFEVVQANGVAAVPAAGAEYISPAVLCHTLSSAEKREAIASVKGSSRKAMIVHILRADGHDELPEHASFRVYDGPVQLLSVVRELVDRWGSGAL